MALLPKLHSLRGLSFGYRVSALALASASSGALGVWWCLDPSSDRAVAALLIAGALLGAAMVAVSVFVPLGEILLRCGMSHAPGIIRYAASPTLVALGAGAAVSSWFVLGPGAEARLTRAAMLPVFVPLLVAALLGLAITLYARAVFAHRRRQVETWRGKLVDFRRRYPDADVRRIEAFLDMETSRQPPIAVHGAFFPGVSKRCFHEDMKLPWMERLEANFGAVKAEIMKVVRDQTALEGEGRGWFRFNRKFRMFRFYRDGWVTESCARCPRTAEILSQVHTNSEIVVAVLHPGGSLRNHLDFSAPTLVYQLALNVPPDCGIRVGTEQRAWVEGHGMVFDNSFEHEVWNDSDDIRVVLLVDFCHPELSQMERKFFSTTSPRLEDNIPAFPHASSVLGRPPLASESTSS